MGNSLLSPERPSSHWKRPDRLPLKDPTWVVEEGVSPEGTLLLPQHPRGGFQVSPSAPPLGGDHTRILTEKMFSGKGAEDTQSHSPSPAVTSTSWFLPVLGLGWPVPFFSLVLTLSIAYSCCFLLCRDNETPGGVTNGAPWSSLHPCHGPLTDPRMNVLSAGLWTSLLLPTCPRPSAEGHPGDTNNAPCQPEVDRVVTEPNPNSGQGIRESRDEGDVEA